MTLSLLTSPDGQWCVVRRGKQTAWYALSGDALDEPAARVELPDAASELVLLGPATAATAPALLALTLTRAGETTALTLLQSPKFERIAELGVAGRWKPAAVTGARAALVAEDARSCTVVRAAGRSLVAQLIDPAGLIDQVLPMDRQQLAIATHRKLELWDAVALRPLTLLKLQLPPPPRVVGVAAGHWWILRPEQQQILLLRLSDGRPFLHAIGAPIRAVVSHPASPWLVVVTSHGLLRLSCFAHAVAPLEAPAAEAYAISPSGDEAILLGCNGFAQAPWVIRLSASAAAAGVPKAASPLVVTTAPMAQRVAPAAAVPAAAEAKAGTAGDKLREMRARAEAGSSLQDDQERDQGEREGPNDEAKPASSLSAEEDSDDKPPQHTSSLGGEADGEASEVDVAAETDEETAGPDEQDGQDGDEAAATEDGGDERGEADDRDDGGDDDRDDGGDDGTDADAALPMAARPANPVRRVGIPGAADPAARPPRGGWAPPGSATGPSWPGSPSAAPRPAWPAGAPSTATPGAAALPGRRAAWPPTARGMARPGGESPPRPAAPRGLALRPGGAMAPRAAPPASPNILPAGRTAASPPLPPSANADAPVESPAPAAPESPATSTPSWSLRSATTKAAAGAATSSASEVELAAITASEPSPESASSGSESDAAFDPAAGAILDAARASASDSATAPDAATASGSAPDPADAEPASGTDPSWLWESAQAPPSPSPSPPAEPSAAPRPPAPARPAAPAKLAAKPLATRPPSATAQPTATTATKPPPPAPNTVASSTAPTPPNFILRGGKSMPRGGAWGEPEVVSDGVTDVIAALGGAGIGDPGVPYDAGAEPFGKRRDVPADDEIPGPLAGANSGRAPARPSASPMRAPSAARPAAAGSPTWMTPSASPAALPASSPDDDSLDDDSPDDDSPDDVEDEVRAADRDARPIPAAPPPRPTSPPPPRRAGPASAAPPVARSWRAELVRYGAELAQGAVLPIPSVTSNELSILARRMSLSDVARQASILLYSAWLSGSPFVPMAQLAAVLGDAAWPEALGTGALGQLGLLRHRDGKVALRRAVADALDGRPWGAIRISGDSSVSPSPIPGRLGRIGVAAWPAWHSHLGKVALVTGKLRRALVEARLAELVAVTFAPLAEYPSPWPSGTNLLVVTDEVGGITELLPELRDPPTS